MQGQSGKLTNMTTKKLHYITGLTITVFITLHLFNHICSIFGAHFHISIMKALRIFYRNLFVETILLAAVFVQIVSGIKLFKINRKNTTSAFEKLHIWSGIYLAFFFIIHLSAVLVGRFYLQLDTNFYFGVAGLNTFPLNLFFIPYYGLAIMSVFGHTAAVHHKKMNQTIFNLTPKQQSKLILISGFFVTCITFYGLTNHFHGVNIPAEYNVLTGK